MLKITLKKSLHALQRKQFPVVKRHILLIQTTFMNTLLLNLFKSFIFIYP